MHFFQDPLDAEFPLGDGTADTEAQVVCPYCAQINDLVLDPGSGPRQEYVEDCQVCCRPWQLRVVYGSEGSAWVEARSVDA
jgi:transposase-like protein